MSTEDLLVCVSSVELLCSAPSRTPTCLAHASYVQNQTQFSKILLVENENASTELFPTLSSPLLHVKDNRVLLPITNLQKQPGGFRKVKVPCATATPLHDHSPNAKSGSVTRNEKRKSDWIVWKTTTISLFCVFFVFFVAVDFYCLLYPEIYTHSPVKLKLGFQNHKKESRNNAVLLEDPCSSKKLHNVTRRVMTNRSVLQKNLPKHMKSNVFSPFDVLYSDKLEPRYLRPSEKNKRDQAVKRRLAMSVYCRAFLIRPELSFLMVAWHLSSGMSYWFVAVNNDEDCEALHIFDQPSLADHCKIFVLRSNSALTPEPVPCPTEEEIQATRNVATLVKSPYEQNNFTTGACCDILGRVRISQPSEKYCVHIEYRLTEFGRLNMGKIPLYVPGNVQVYLIWSYPTPHGLRRLLVAIVHWRCWSVDTLPIVGLSINLVKISAPSPTRKSTGKCSMGGQGTDVWIREILNGNGFQDSLQVAIGENVVPPCLENYVSKESTKGQ
ncbi:hypothetical protein CLF_107659 [Clonorchis sinensis]|uniref:Uncharacterized protein n=1 Tax=Clonorchis sinensis TaxID=79923 RepID=G7YQW6_CLOSI|nr:hypothetical protein CLF_107659 [Clonorchis sinensis]